MKIYDHWPTSSQYICLQSQLLKAKARRSKFKDRPDYTARAHFKASNLVYEYAVY